MSHPMILSWKLKWRIGNFETYKYVAFCLKKTKLPFSVSHDVTKGRIGEENSNANSIGHAARNDVYQWEIEMIQIENKISNKCEASSASLHVYSRPKKSFFPKSTFSISQIVIFQKLRFLRFNQTTISCAGHSFKEEYVWYLVLMDFCHTVFVETCFMIGKSFDWTFYGMTDLCILQLTAYMCKMYGLCYVCTMEIEVGLERSLQSILHIILKLKCRCIMVFSLNRSQWFVMIIFFCCNVWFLCE